MRDELKVLGYAAIVCVTCSLILSVAYSALNEMQVANVVLDQKFNVLKALGVEVVDAHGKKTMKPAEIGEFFEKNVQSIVLDAQGAVVNEEASKLTDGQITGGATGSKTRYPLYIYANPQTGEKRYAMHISGKGLWSTLKGYLAVGDDLAHIAGLTFYDHKETPGLGAEIDRTWFQEQFTNKWLFRDGKPVKFVVAKGKAKDSAPQATDHAVDGIPGATMTGKGLQRFLNEDAATYNQYFETLRKK